MSTTTYFRILMIFGCTATFSSAQSFDRQPQFDYSSQAIGSIVLPLADGNLLTVGSIGDQQDVTSADIAVFKTDANGHHLWAKQYASPNYIVSGCQYSIPRLEYAVDAVELADGYVIAGCYDRFQANWPLCGPNNHLLTAQFDYLVMKINLSGELVWAKCFGLENATDIATGIQKTKDGGLLLQGFTQSGTLSSGQVLRPFFLKLDASGNRQWSKTLAGFYQENSAFFIAAARRMPITQLNDGNYVCAVSTGLQSYFIKISAAGQVMWAKTLAHGGAVGEINQQWGGGAASAAYFHSIAELPNGDLAFLGNFGFAATAFPTPNANGNNSLFVGLNTAWYLETTTNGVFVRNSIFSHPNPGGNIFYDYSATDMEVLPNGHLLVAGLHGWAAVLLEFDPQATDTEKIVWARRFATYTYSNIPYGYDLPSCARRGDQAYLLTDNYNLARTTIAPTAEACHPVEAMQAISLSTQVLGNFSPDFYSLDDSAQVSLLAQPLLLTGETTCNLTAATEPQTTRSFQVFPSPLHGQRLHVEAQPDMGGEYICVLRDQMGRVVLRQYLTLVAGQQIFDLNVVLAAGAYYLSLQGPTRFEVQKVIKIN